ncbi:unnamed protein product [Callosobruchus maculatus]|uniref:Pyroglutamyl-peptidase I n=1 Tax=Callosobruchus maculatus TaxID=64391 RepID=A0A653DHD7_CALMS|nr:unnamed protein product [Callosobruchus maculatus]
MDETVLATGFGPFGEHKVNASWEAVKLLPDTIQDTSIIKKEIPVIYGCVDSTVPSLWRQYNPLLVIHVGVSSLASKLTIEKCAHGSGYNRCDVAGTSHTSGDLQCNLQDCIYTAIDTDVICEHLNSTGSVKSCTSCDAGRYLCEYIYYKSLSIDHSRCLFIHVPPIDHPYSTKEMASAIESIIKCCLQQQKERNQLKENVCSMKI